MKKNITLLIVLSALLANMLYASTPQLNGSYSMFQDWFPVLTTAAMAVFMIASLFYMAGYMLNNNKLKGIAVNELQQAAGSILLLIITIGVLYLVGTTTGLSFSNLLSSNQQSGINTICNTYLAGDFGSSGNTYPIDFLSSSYTDPNSGLRGPTNSVCSLVAGSGNSDSITKNIDYGLGSMYVIIANMSNQTVGQINAMYNLESITFFLRNLIFFVGVCTPAECLLPFGNEESSEIILSYKPYDGYVLQRTIMPTLNTQEIMSFYLFLLQLIIILILMMGWPVLLGAAIVLRAIPITRAAGGLIFAGTIVGIIIWPTIFLIEYHSLNSFQSPSIGSGGSIPGFPICGEATNPTYLYCYTSAKSVSYNDVYKMMPSTTIPNGLPNPNTLSNPNGVIPACKSIPTSNSQSTTCFVQRSLSMFVFPPASQIISLYACYPTSSNIFPVEMAILTGALANVASLPFTFLTSLFSSSLSASSFSFVSFLPVIGNTCAGTIGPFNIYSAYISLANLYGLMSVSAFIIPILNGLLLISATTGLSSLIGGEKTIIGLSRFI